MKKRILVFILVLGMVTCTGIHEPVTVHAEPTITQQQEDVESQIQQMDSQIESNMRQIEDTKNKIVKTETQIKETNDKLTKAEEEINKYSELYSKRLKALYINGDFGYFSYLNVLCESNNLLDFQNKLEAVSVLVKHDRKMMDDLKTNRELVNKTKLALEKQKTNLVTMQGDINKKLVELNDIKSKQQQLLAQIKVVAANKASIQRTRPVYNENIPLSRGGLTLANADRVISYAENYLGVPYVWGGTSPSGFDCSGYMQYVYAHFGYSLGRTTWDQVNNGSSVIGELKPGDLVFFGSDLHHVGMYIGNGQYIHAPQTGDNIKISNLGSYYTARRIIR